MRAECRQLRRGKRGVGGICRAPFRIRHERPDVSVALLARKASGVDSVAFQLRIRGKRRDMFALAGVRVELPAVIGTLDGGAVESAERKRKRAVRADVA